MLDAEPLKTVPPPARDRNVWRPPTMAAMSSTPTAPLVAAGLIGGYAAARHAGRSDLATAVFTAAGAVCTRSWLRSSGRRVTAVLLGTYLFAFWVSHPLAKRIGGWPSVLTVTTAATAVTAGLAGAEAT
jgi:hypothetical protein